MLNNAQTLFDSRNAALPGPVADSDALTDLRPIPDSFAFGFPLFFRAS